MKWSLKILLTIIIVLLTAFVLIGIIYGFKPSGETVAKVLMEPFGLT